MVNVGVGILLLIHHLHQIILPTTQMAISDTSRESVVMPFIAQVALHHWRGVKTYTFVGAIERWMKKVYLSTGYYCIVIR